VVETLSPDNFADFLEEGLWGLLKDVTPPKKWKYVASEGTKGQYSN